MIFGYAFKFFTLVYSICFWISIPFIFFFIKLYGSYRGIDSNNLFNTLPYTILFYIIVLFLYYIFALVFRKISIKRKVKIFYNAINTNYKAKKFSSFMLTLSVLSIIFISFSRDFTLGNISYGEQLELNAGNGVYMFFIYLYLPAILIRILIDENLNRVKFIKYLLISILFGFFVFQFTGGSRNVFLGAVGSIIFLFFLKKIVTLLELIVMGGGIILLSAYFAYLRYGAILNSYEDIVYMFYIYTLDSFSTLDTLNSIIEFYSEREDDYLLGFDLFFVQFYSFIPRFIWHDKPVLLYTNSMYITQEVLGHPGNIIYSTSIVGASIAMFGKKLYLVTGVITSIILLFIDKLLKSSSLFLHVIAVSIFPLIFFLIRENVEYFIYRFFFLFISLSFVYFIYRIFLKLLGLLK